MSESQYGVACCACAICLVLSGCGNSQPIANSLNADSVTVDSDQAPVGDDPSLELSLPPPITQYDDESPWVSLGPEGDSNVLVGDSRYPLSSALGDIWGTEGEHYSVDFTLTNGKFLVAPTEVNGVIHSLLVPVQATAIVYAELYSPGSSLSFVTYSFSSFGNAGGVLAGNAFFDQAYVGVDTNNSGDVEDDEKIAIIGGTIEFTGKLPDIELRFNVTLENGLAAEGYYTGLFDFADRQ